MNQCTKDYIRFIIEQEVKKEIQYYSLNGQVIPVNPPRHLKERIYDRIKREKKVSNLTLWIYSIMTIARLIIEIWRERRGY